VTEPTQVGQRTAVAPLRIMVLVGTDVHAFDRLLDWVEGYQSTAELSWTLQYGTSRPSSLAGASAYLARADLAGALANADVVVCHGGPATITEARQAGHIPLVVPRDPRRGEHIDDHQQRFARRLARSGMIEICETEAALRTALDRAEAVRDRFRIDPRDADAAVITSALQVGKIADGLVAATRPARPPRQARRHLARFPAPVDVPPARRRAADDAAARPAPPAPQKSIEVLYVGGWGRSGSTLVERLLGEMPDLVGAGEVTHLWQRGLADNELCACGTPFRACPFWAAVGETAFGGWDQVDANAVLALKHRVDRTRFVPRLALPTSLTRRRRELGSYTELHRQVYAAIAAVSGATVVIDSSKHSSLAFALRHDRSIDLRVLHLVRDGRGVAYSWSKQVHRPEATGGDAFMPQYSVGKSSLLWTAHNWLFDMLRIVHRRTRLMRYEDVIADPRTGLAAIRTFLDLPADAMEFLDTAAGAPVARVGSSHSIAGNPMRFTSGELVLRTDQAWRAAAPRGRRFAIGLLTWPGRARYGYLDRGNNS
jgi:UDP-N-acetylglucosamine transferase subunit ALG13